ncbi:MAG: NlpC/P60 family protein, partial [Pseudomonadota bacterium]
MPVMARLFLLVFVALLGACADRSPSLEPHSDAPFTSPAAFSPGAEDVLFRALGLVGTPYRYGGNTPAGGFDCSGLIGFVYRDA